MISIVASFLSAYPGDGAALFLVLGAAWLVEV